jgi:DNA repair photolyase
LGEAPVAELEVWEDRSKSILSRNDSADLDFRWSVNPYRGCFHACAYCYARPTHEYLGLGAGTDFERKIFVKPEAAALLDAAFRKPSWARELVMFSGVTDCYQPLEAAWGLTRACLEVCEKHGNPVGIVTKSALVRRDKDLLARLAKKTRVSVSISIPFLSEDTSRKVEPGAPTVARRFEAMRELAAVGVRVGIGVAPIIPGLNDHDVPHLLRRAKECGASFAFRTLLRLPGSTREVFLTRIAQEFPDSAARIENRIRESRGGKITEERPGLRFRGMGRYWDAVDTLWNVWLRRAELTDLDTDTVREPEAPRATQPPPLTSPPPGPRRRGGKRKTSEAQIELPWT